MSPLAGPRAQTVLRLRPVLLGGLLALMAAWAVVSIARLPPLDGPPTAFEGDGLLGVLSRGRGRAVCLLGVALVPALPAPRRRRDLLSMAVAFVLLAEAMIAVSLSRNWHASWWEWHVLLLAAFAAIALGARREYQRRPFACRRRSGASTSRRRSPASIAGSPRR